MPNSGAFRKGDGRKRKPKGAVNKVTAAAKSAIELAAQGLGGAKRLQAWAREDPRNESAFWTVIYPKLLPLQVTGDDGKPLVPSALTFVFQQQPDSENRT